MANKANNIVNVVNVIGGVGAAVALLGSLYFSSYLGRSLGSPNKQSINAQHVLADKVGFRASGKLKDGRAFDYSITGLEGYIWEDVSVIDKSVSVLRDLNHDRKVDLIELNGYDTNIKINSSGSYEYDTTKFDNSQVEFIVETANQLYLEVSSNSDLEKKLKSYSTRIIGNPLLPEPQAEREN